MTSQRATATRGGLRFKFIGETMAELRKVVWLNRREVVYLTSLVLIVVIIVGAFLGMVDFAFAKLVDSLFLGR